MCICFSESIISFAEVASGQHQHQYCFLNAEHSLVPERYALELFSAFVDPSVAFCNKRGDQLHGVCLIARLAHMYPFSASLSLRCGRFFLTGSINPSIHGLHHVLSIALTQKLRCEASGGLQQKHPLLVLFGPLLPAMGPNSIKCIRTFIDTHAAAAA